jgi:predicted PurR-regulated permease PerM
LQKNLDKNEIVSIAFEILIKSVLLGVIMYYAFLILKPFIIPVLWGIILAVALAPVISKMETVFKVKRTIVVIVFTLITISTLLVPTYLLSESVIDSSKELVADLRNGDVVIPMPTENIKDWPLIGENVYALWNSAGTNLEETLLKFKPQLAEYSKKVVSMIMGTLGSIFGFVLSLIIAGFFLAKAHSATQVYKSILSRIVGEDDAQEWSMLSAMTIRSVAQGVLGIAIIQATFSLIGMVMMDVPFAWLWAFIVMFLTIIQLPALIMLGPVIAYVYSYADPTSATIFAVYAVIVGASDGVLKPIFLGRGVDVPMLVILFGAIGGMILSGVLGLFVGAVGLALSYKLFMAWLSGDAKAEMEPAI